MAAGSGRTEPPSAARSGDEGDETASDRAAGVLGGVALAQQLQPRVAAHGGIVVGQPAGASADWLAILIEHRDDKLNITIVRARHNNPDQCPPVA
jgi:hypothetical protein